MNIGTMELHRILSTRLQEYREMTFHLSPASRVRTREEAVEFVKERGFIFFWPISGINLPSLWTAVAGERPVADAHDDPGHVTWDWKDQLLGKREWYYAKVLRKKSTMISFAMLPAFYALSENYGSPEEDYLTLYEQGRLTQEAKSVYEALLFEGALDTIALRKAARLSSQVNESRFNKALADLQADFKILPVGVAEVGAWHYAFIYEIVARHYPDIPDLAQSISEQKARVTLLKLYARTLGALRMEDVMRVFGWTNTIARACLGELIQAGVLVEGCTVESQPGEWMAIPELV